MEEKNLPLVSVPVVTYNSSKTVLETLDSIYNQTYPNIELVVSDDCSTDDTIEICSKWVEEHKERFVHVELLKAEKNTGTSGNCNRAASACNGVWIKGIAGDDILMDDCIESCVKYVLEHEDVIFLFGKQDAFGADEARCNELNSIFDYAMFAKTPEEQLLRLLFDSNFIPATTAFYHKKRYEQTGVKNDERIPLLEDWPKWINLLKAGVQFHFIDKILVKYRIGGVSTSGYASSKMYESGRLFYYYYQFPERYKCDKDKTIQEIVREEMKVYDEMLKIASNDTLQLVHELEDANDMIAYYRQELYNRVNSKAYRIGSALLKPFKLLR